MKTITLTVPDEVDPALFERIVRAAFFVIGAKKLRKLLKEEDLDELVQVLEEVM